MEGTVHCRRGRGTGAGAGRRDEEGARRDVAGVWVDQVGGAVSAVIAAGVRGHGSSAPGTRYAGSLYLPASPLSPPTPPCLPASPPPFPPVSTPLPPPFSPPPATHPSPAPASHRPLYTSPHCPPHPPHPPSPNTLWLQGLLQLKVSDIKHSPPSAHMPLHPPHPSLPSPFPPPLSTHHRSCGCKALYS